MGNAPGKKNKPNRRQRPPGFGEPGPGGSFGRPGPQQRPQPFPKPTFGGAGPSMGDAGGGGHPGLIPGYPPGPHSTMPPAPPLGGDQIQTFDKHGRSPDDPNYKRGTWDKGTFPGPGAGANPGPPIYRRYMQGQHKLPPSMADAGMPIRGQKRPPRPGGFATDGAGTPSPYDNYGSMGHYGGGIPVRPPVNPTQPHQNQTPGGSGGNGGGNGIRAGEYTGNPNWSYMQALKHAGVNTETGDANYNNTIYNHGGKQKKMKKLLRKGVINRDQFQEYKGQLRDWRETFGKPGTFDAFMKNLNMSNPYGTGVDQSLLRAGWQSGLRGKDLRGLVGGPTGNEASHLLENPQFAEYFMQHPEMLGELSAWQKAGGNNYVNAAQAQASGGQAGYSSPWQNTTWGQGLMDIYNRPENVAARQAAARARYSSSGGGGMPQAPQIDPNIPPEELAKLRALQGLG